MKLYRVIKWRFANKQETDVYLLDFFCISKHYIGFRDGGFRVEFSFYKTWYTWSFKRGLESLKDVFNNPHFRVVIRFNKYFYTLQPLNIKEQYKLVEVL